VFSAVLVLSAVAAIDPVRIGIVALLISRPRPMVNLLVFWLGGMAAGISIALVVLLFLRDFMLAVMRVALSAASKPVVGDVQLAVGVLAVTGAALLWARHRAPVPMTAGVTSVLVAAPNTPTGSSRLSMRGRLEHGSLAMAFVAGVAMATPPVEYVSAIIAILTTGATADTQVGEALMFTLVAFTIAEVPLISYLAAPAKTLAVVQRLNDWIGARRQGIPAVVIGACGVLLMVTGMGKF
jgi:Sap, sulfolipid-1-addressing protein